MFEVAVEHTFAAGHALREYRGKCENVHGHNYRVQVVVRGEKLDKTGMLADFVALKKALRDTCEPMDHVFLNEMPPFDTVNPTAENMAVYIAEKLQEVIGDGNGNPVEVAEVKVWETDIQSATYRPVKRA
ncbi:MAG TPA: 6-carboxytetrahydropterin synthase QueD [Bryobacteraceae bacterium]|nr:6-carboxytetrahydropterin synthase QueD [Bryobacteraceae bacterium]